MFIRTHCATAPKRLSIHPDENEHADGPPKSSNPNLPFLSNVTANCYVRDVYPDSFVPLYLFRKGICNAVGKVKAILSSARFYSRVELIILYKS